MMELALNENYYNNTKIEKEMEVEIMEKALRLELENKELDLIDKITNFFNFKSKEEKIEKRINTEAALKDQKINLSNATYVTM